MLWQIQKKEDIIKIINLIHGYMRTPKLEALHKAINCFHKFDSFAIECLAIDNSLIDSNGWLAGFSNDDANFFITLTDCKKNGKVTSKKVQTFFRIELSQNYHRGEDKTNISYFIIPSLIIEYLKVNLYTRIRKKRDKLFYAFMVIAHGSISHKKVRAYLDKFVLYSFEYLVYQDWISVQDLRRPGGILTNQQITEVEFIKSQFNSNRKTYDFSHLESLL